MNRTLHILSWLGLVLTIIVLMSIFGKWARKGEENKPLKYLPVIQGRWENAKGFVEFGHNDTFTRNTDGKTVTGTYRPWNEGEYMIETAVGGGTKKELLRCKYDETTLKTQDEAGRVQVYQRKAEQ